MMLELEEELKLLNINPCVKCETGEKELTYDCLNKDQKKVYNDICNLFKKKGNAIIVINTPSGTGKTFLLSTFVANYKKPVTYITFRKDQASEISLKKIKTYTYISFNMHYFNLPYHGAIQMFRSCGYDEVEELHNLIVSSKKFVCVDNTTTFIIDMYTISSPNMLLLLYILSLKHRLHLIFSGYHMQLNGINKSLYHNENNFYIVQIFNDLMINQLTNTRTCDIVLEDKLTSFRKLIQQFQPIGNIQFYYNLRYFLYSLFRSKYFTEERFDTVYIAQTHRKITMRLSRFIQYLQSIGKPYVEAPYFYHDSNDFIVPLLPKRKESKNLIKKFFPTLILVEGYKYIYINKDGVHNIVVLEKIVYEDIEIKYLRIRFENNYNRVEEIERVSLNYYQILPAYRLWLLRNVIHTDELWQFPLRPYALTYHAALGRTIEKVKVELSIEHFANFLYIGLSCVRHESDIYKIHDEQNLLSYMVTDYMENVRNDTEYYYNCPVIEYNKEEILACITNKRPNKFIDNINWTTVNSVNLFEKNIVFLRIARSVYQESLPQKKEVNTPLMQIAKFVKKNPNVILETIKMVSVNENKSNNNKNKKKKMKKKQQQKKENKECKECDSLVYLRNEYYRWLAEIEKSD